MKRPPKAPQEAQKNHPDPRLKIPYNLAKKHIGFFFLLVGTIGQGGLKRAARHKAEQTRGRRNKGEWGRSDSASSEEFKDSCEISRQSLECQRTNILVFLSMFGTQCWCDMLLG